MKSKFCAKAFFTGLATTGLLMMPAWLQAQEAVERVEEIVVTGSYLNRLRQSDVASPTSVFGADYLSDIGAANIADFVSSLTINNGSQNNPDAFTQNITTGTSNFNLRGLGVASTLVLLNGRRQVNTSVVTNDGISFVDTSSLVPNIVLKRIEIVKDGAAAIYGTDAVAGVVNFITDDNFRGSAVDLRYSAVTGEGDQEDITAELKFGWGNDTTNYLVAGSYYDRSPLTTGERRLSRPQDDTSALGNPGSFFLSGELPVVDPTGCASQGGVPIPNVGAQANLDEAGLFFQGGFCGFDFGDFFNLVAEEERVNLYALVTHSYARDSTFHFQVTYADNDARRGNSPSLPFLQLDSAEVPVDNPGNIFPRELGPVLFFGRVIGNGGTVSSSESEYETLRLSMDFEGELFGLGDWRYDIGVSWGRNESVFVTEDTITERFANALDGLGGADCNPLTGVRGQGSCQFFNPFSSSFNEQPNDPALLDFLIEQQVIDAASELAAVDAVFTGSVGTTVAGPIGLALGLQYRREELTRDFDDFSNQDAFAFLIGSSDFVADRDVFAAFAEVSIALSDNLDFSAAVRYEDYGGGVGDTFDPKVSLLYRPTDSVSLRGSFSTSFRAPGLFQTNGEATSLNQVVDPVSGSTFFAAIRNLPPVGAGERNIQPEESDAFNLGASFTPGSFSIDIDYWNFDFSDAIVQESFQAIVNADPLGDRVVRSSAGTILFVFPDFVNASSIETDGLDIAAKYDFDTNIGTFQPFIDYTKVFNYDIADPQAGLVDGAGNRNFTNFGSPTPETRYIAGVSYVGNSLTARVAYRFIDSFTDDQNDVRIDSFNTVDAQASYRFGESYKATLGVTNLSNEPPPQVFTNGGFESRTHDPRGRIVYLQFGAEF